MKASKPNENKTSGLNDKVNFMHFLFCYSLLLFLSINLLHLIEFIFEKKIMIFLVNIKYISVVVVNIWIMITYLSPDQHYLLLCIIVINISLTYCACHFVSNYSRFYCNNLLQKNYLLVQYIYFFRLIT